MRLSRDLLTQAFPNNPRLVAELEELDSLLESAEGLVAELRTASDEAKARLATLEGTESQPLSEKLSAIAATPDDQVGALEIIGPDQVAIRGIDTADDACLVSRSRVLSFAGKGATADRPVLSDTMTAIYFDTTLATEGQPVFWTGAQWVDSLGAVV